VPLLVLLLLRQVDDINREMASVFGVPFTPEGTCLGPSSHDATGGMWPHGHPADSAPFSAAGHAAAAGQQTPAPASDILQEIRQCTRQIQGQLQHLQQLLQQQRSLDIAGSGSTAAAGPLAEQNTYTPAPQLAAEIAGRRHQQPEQQLSHVDESGRASMVDVASKGSSGRVAVASCRVILGEAAFQAVAANAIAKGDVLRVAQIAGIQGAKATAQLIPLCHNIFISSVDVDLQLDEACYAVDIRSTARATGQTGVEMEALTGAGVAALTVYDMTKAVSKGIQITDLQLDYKEGGKSGTWRREG